MLHLIFTAEPQHSNSAACIASSTGSSKIYFVSNNLKCHFKTFEIELKPAFFQLVTRNYSNQLEKKSVPRVFVFSLISRNFSKPQKKRQVLVNRFMKTIANVM